MRMKPPGFFNNFSGKSFGISIIWSRRFYINHIFRNISPKCGIFQSWNFRFRTMLDLYKYFKSKNSHFLYIYIFPISKQFCSLISMILQNIWNQSNIGTGLFFHFCLRLWQCSFHWIISDGVVSGMGFLLPTPSVWFSLNRSTLRSTRLFKTLTSIKLISD